jgi:hypothetical protein
MKEIRQSHRLGLLGVMMRALWWAAWGFRLRSEARPRLKSSIRPIVAAICGDLEWPESQRVLGQLGFPG